MPYINDRLADNQESNNRERLRARATRESRFTFDPEAVIEALKQAIVGQDHVIEAMGELLYVLKADFAEASRPLGVSLFLGPTGVGKTETVRVLAKAVLGDAKQVCRIDMNTLAQEHYSAALTGAPPGYVGSKEGHTLFDIEAIEGSFSRPGIVLFDEIEKASKEVIRSILNILDTGTLRLTGGTKQINFSNALIFMTSNLGARELAQHGAMRNRTWWQRLTVPRQNPHPWQIVEPILKGSFDPEFLNRIERKLLFNPLEHRYVDGIIQLEIEKLNQRLQRKNASLTLAPSARAQLASYYDNEYGARNIAQLCRLKLYPVLAKALMQQLDRQHFELGFKEGLFFVV